MMIPLHSDFFAIIDGTDIEEEIIEALLSICREIVEGVREGNPVQTAFIIGDSANVLAKSHQLFLNPFEGQPSERRMITNPDNIEIIKALSQLDGAFVIQGNGFIEAALRKIPIEKSNIKQSKGLGSRHFSVVRITQVTNSIGIIISQAGGTVSIYKNGILVKRFTEGKM